MKLLGKVIAVLSVVGVALYIILTFIGLAFQIYVQPFSAGYDWLSAHSLVQYLPLGPPILGLLWLVYGLGARSHRQERPQVEKVPEPKKVDLPPTLVVAKADPAPQVAPKPTISEEAKALEKLADFDDPNELTDKEVRRIIRRYEKMRAAMGSAIKMAAGVLGIMMVYFLVTNLYQIVGWVVTVLYWLNLFVLLNQQQTLLMVLVYIGLLSVFLAVYMVPYRLLRKELIIADGRTPKTQGRVISIRGVSTDDQSPERILYGLWVMWRVIRDKERPNPHRFPFGDPYYLLGNTERAINRFNWSITYQSNTLGIFARRAHPKHLYGRGAITMSPFTIRVTGDGVMVRVYPRQTAAAPPHEELSNDELAYYERDEEPYRAAVESTIHYAGRMVDGAVQADPEVGKEKVKKFQTPGGLKALGLARSSIKKTLEAQEEQDKVKRARPKGQA